MIGVKTLEVTDNKMRHQWPKEIEVKYIGEIEITNYFYVSLLVTG